MLDDAPVCRQDSKNHLYRSVSLAGKDFHTIDNTRLIYKSYHLFSALLCSASMPANRSSGADVVSNAILRLFRSGILLSDTQENNLTFKPKSRVKAIETPRSAFSHTTKPLALQTPIQGEPSSPYGHSVVSITLSALFPDYFTESFRELAVTTVRS